MAVKIRSTVQPPSRNSVISQVVVANKQIVPRELGCKVIPLGEALKFWDNFNLDLYKRLSFLRATEIQEDMPRKPLREKS